MKPIALHRLLYIVFVLLMFVSSLFILKYGMTEMEWEDFYVFYSAAKSALQGNSLYQITGDHNLPFWYFPWTAWIFLPFTLWSESTALLVYKGVFVVAAVLTINSLVTYYDPEFSFWNKILILAAATSMSLQTMIVGQLEYILLGLIVISMYAVDQKRYILAGVLIPFLWTKPHLLIVFTLAMFWLGGIPLIVSTAVSFMLMAMVETVRSPGWYLEMLNLLKNGQARIDGPIFTTLPSMLGFQENWVGTANLPITVMLIVLAILLVWKFRTLPPVPLLSLALAASLFCAPRAYAYDLPLLIPVMVWLTARNFRSGAWVWLFAAILPPLVRYSAATFLVVLLVFVLGLLKAFQEQRVPLITPRAG